MLRLYGMLSGTRVVDSASCPGEEELLFLWCASGDPRVRCNRGKEDPVLDLGSKAGWCQRSKALSSPECCTLEHCFLNPCITVSNHTRTHLKKAKECGRRIGSTKVNIKFLHNFDLLAFPSSSGGDGPSTIHILYEELLPLETAALDLTFYGKLRE